MSCTDTWMPLYIADYLADTRRLSTLEHGAYLLLLMEYWRQGPLPDDDRELCAIVRLDRKLWDRGVGPAVRRFFHREDDGLLHQKRIDAERSKAVELSDKRRAAAQQRGSKPVTKDEANVQQLHQQLHQQMPTHAGVAPPSPSPREEPSSLRSDALASQSFAELIEPDAPTLLFREGPTMLARLAGKPLTSLWGILASAGKTCATTAPACWT